MLMYLSIIFTTSKDNLDHFRNRRITLVQKKVKIINCLKYFESIWYRIHNYKYIKYIKYLFLSQYIIRIIYFLISQRYKLKKPIIKYNYLIH